jgi:rhodanese-related sulfurtransferase
MTYRRTIRLAADVGLFIGCVLVVVLVAQRGHIQSTFAEPRVQKPLATADLPPPLVAGDKLAIPGIDWTTAERHAVILVWSTCPACELHRPFYKQISDTVHSTSALGLVGLPLDPLDIAHEWFATNGITPHQVARVVRPPDIGLLLVPTVMIVTSEGVVTDLWFASLDEAMRTRFLQRLAQPSMHAPFTNTSRVTEQRASEFALTPGQLLLDIRDREESRVRPIPGAVNIPSDELQVRARAELGRSEGVAIACANQRLVSCRTTAWELAQMGVKTFAIVTLE